MQAQPLVEGEPTHKGIPTALGAGRSNQINQIKKVYKPPARKCANEECNTICYYSSFCRRHCVKYNICNYEGCTRRCRKELCKKHKPEIMEKNRLGTMRRKAILKANRRVEAAPVIDTSATEAGTSGLRVANDLTDVNAGCLIIAN